MANIIDMVNERINREIIKSLKGRIDGRKEDDYRKIEIKQGVLKHAEGSALARIGKTQAIAGVKVGLAQPFKDTPDEGILIVNAELLPFATVTEQPGPPNEREIELARVVDRIIRSSEAIDLKSLFIEEGKVYSIFIDIYVLDYDGNMWDASMLASVAALQNTYLPKYENEALIMEEKARDLDLKCLPVSTTFARIGKRFVVDPNLVEEEGSDALITFGTIEDYFCGVQKIKGSIKKEHVPYLLDKAMEKGKELRELLKKVK